MSTTPPGTPSPLPLTTLPDHLEAARWFGGKGRPFTVVSVTRVGEIPVPMPEPRVVVDVIEVRYDDVDGDAADATELYQLPLALYEHPQERLSHAFISWHDEAMAGAFDVEDEHWVHAYDAVHDREAMAGWLSAFAAVPADSGEITVVDDHADTLVFHRLPGHELDPQSHSTPFSGEQSNSSVMFGDDSLLKVFRKVTLGVNPDIEIHDALTRAGSEHVAALYGWLEAVSEEGPLQLALLQQFLKTASDGWELALGSVRGLLADADLTTDGEVNVQDAGGDFADEAMRLGAALAEVHGVLAAEFGTGTLEGGEPAALARRMTQRLDDAVAVVPQLQAHRDRLAQTFAGVGGLGSITTQRVHGDLHLGQTLRTVVGWKLVDFEGEPAKPLADRSRPDSPWRDVAGMLRSFDYAAHAVVLTAGGADVVRDDRRHSRAAAWAARNAQAFLDGYTDGRPLTDTEQTLLRAYVADKAAYEAVYEARNRPGWLPIPLAALGATA